MTYGLDKKYLKGHVQGAGGGDSAHDVQPFVRANIDGRENGFERFVIFKDNKNGDVEASINEVAFSELAALFMPPGLTPKPLLFKDGKAVIGVGSVNCFHDVEEHQRRGKLVEVDFENGQLKHATLPANIPEPPAEPGPNNEDYKNYVKERNKGYKFLDKLGDGFFNHLLEKHNTPSSGISIDMESLAEVFGASYVLEEDDLHKGNIGVYATREANGNIIYHFFKIDHDLMFIDKIMSYKDARFANLHYGSKAFMITRKDLVNFPDLQHSGNHYWPTQKRLFVVGDKAYKNKAEREAYKALKNNPEFQAAKWKVFLKYLVMPDALVEYALTQHLDPNNHDDADRLEMVKDALLSRVVNLKINLLRTPEFRRFMQSPEGLKALTRIKTEISHYYGNNNFSAEIWRNFASLRDAVNQTHSDDSPLHAIVKTDDYRFEETLPYHRRHINKHDNLGKTPLDIVAKRAREEIERGAPSTKTWEIIKHMKKHGAKTHHEVMPKRPKLPAADPKVKPGLQAFEDALRKIRSTRRLSLKRKKQRASKLLKAAIPGLTQEELITIKDRIQMKSPDPSYKFIRRARTKLWILRRHKGSYPQTATSHKMVQAIDNAIAANQYRQKADPPITKGIPPRAIQNHGIFGSGRAGMPPVADTPPPLPKPRAL